MQIALTLPEVLNVVKMTASNAFNYDKTAWSMLSFSELSSGMLAFGFEYNNN